uniref:Uncharacterized protein n=1 Tax=Romanomermis culicivorax TaxID=13658 RepID=A0A915IEF0_ROMCU
MYNDERLKHADFYKNYTGLRTYKKAIQASLKNRKYYFFRCLHPDRDKKTMFYKTTKYNPEKRCENF